MFCLKYMVMWYERRGKFNILLWDGALLFLFVGIEPIPNNDNAIAEEILLN